MICAFFREEVLEENASWCFNFTLKYMGGE